MERKRRNPVGAMKIAGKPLRGLAYFAVVGLALAVGSARAINSKYEIERISMPDPNVTITEAYSINDDGEVVGVYGKESGGRCPDYMGFFVYKRGIAREIKTNEENSPRGCFGPSIPLPGPKINDFGDMLLGKVVYKSDDYKIFFDFQGTDLNNHCDVVGYDLKQNKQGYLYSNGEKTDLGFRSSRFYINDNKQIVGSDYDKGYFWENGEKILLDGKLYLMGINNNGDFIGFYRHGGTYIFKNKGKDRILISIRYPYAINDNGQVVGRDYVSAAALYDKGEKVILHDLLPEDKDTEWEILEWAMDINNQGQIAGIGMAYVNDELRRSAFLMTPIPLKGDFNKDNKIDSLDFAEFANQWLEDWNYHPPGEE